MATVPGERVVQDMPLPVHTDTRECEKFGGQLVLRRNEFVQRGDRCN